MLKLRIISAAFTGTFIIVIKVLKTTHCVSEENCCLLQVKPAHVNVADIIHVQPISKNLYV
jgi:hypothetical protein